MERETEVGLVIIIFTFRSLSSTAILLIFPAFFSPVPLPVLPALEWVVEPTVVSSLKLQAGKMRGEEGRARETRRRALDVRDEAARRGVQGQEDDEGVVVAVVSMRG